jgi:hypothetical protein
VHEGADLLREKRLDKVQLVKVSFTDEGASYMNLGI